MAGYQGYPSVVKPSSSSVNFGTAVRALLTKDPPTPPTWNQNYDKAITINSPYTIFPLDPNTLEYQVLFDMVKSANLNISKIEQVVNPDLWIRFVNTRKDMLRSKSDDLQLLRSLGFDEKEISHRFQGARNFTKDPILQTTPYSDNMALLFHCCRNGGLEAILKQGLDERVGNGGTLGKGIYFADNPSKSLQYDGGTGVLMVFGVLLGDCLSMDRGSTQQQRGPLVREPEKQGWQQRNQADLFFDSIVGRPSAGGVNEYVIFNRYQCCPMYLIHIQRGGGGYQQASMYHPYVRGRITPQAYAAIPILQPYTTSAPQGYPTPTSQPPPIAWTGRPALPNPNPGQPWSHLATTIFQLMNVPSQGQDQIVPALKGSKLTSPDDVSEEAPARGPEPTPEEKLMQLNELGFTNQEQNLELLLLLDYDLDATIHQLLDAQDQERLLNGVHDDYLLDFAGGNQFLDIGQPLTAELPTRTPSIATNKIFCEICYSEYESNSSIWKALPCGHKTCTPCYQVIETTRTTMSGKRCTFVRCPFCQKVSGVEVGTCPNGRMTVSYSPQNAAAYEPFGSICIQYHIQEGRYSVARIAYLPNTPEGQEVLKLLQTAWDRRLCFTIGTSSTTGATDAVVWNIHHKTSLNGGIGSHGYPDPTYLTRVKDELKFYGIV